MWSLICILVDILVANLCCNYMHVHVTFVHMCAHVLLMKWLPCHVNVSSFIHRCLDASS